MRQPLCSFKSLLTLAILALAGAPLAADVVETFDSGYPGSAGGGWVGGWSTIKATPATFISGPAIDNTTPLNGGGNYLATTLESTNLGAAQGTVYRQYDSSGGIDLTLPHRVSFDVRFNEFTSGTRFFIYDRTGPSTGTDSNDTWQVAIQPTGWRVTDGPHDSVSSTSDVSIGVSLVADRVYSVIVDVFPALREYVVTVDDGVDPAVTSSVVHFRNPNPAVGGYLHFGGRDDNTGTVDTWSFGVDSIAITLIPTPAALPAGLFMLTMTLVRRRRVG